MSRRTLAKYFPDIDFRTDVLTTGGYIFAHVSIFDHWLSEAECADNAVFTYEGAVEAGALEEYLESERKFLRFYKLLAEDGVICNRPRPCREIAGTDLQLEAIFTDSLRERRFMDVHFISESVRVMGAYDRTDIVFFENKTRMIAFKEKVEQAGLFLLI